MAKSSLISILSLEYAPVYAVIILVLFVLLVDVMYYQFTKFTKTITIKSKYNAMKSGRYGGTKYMIEDTDLNLYKVINVVWKLDFNQTEDWNRMEVGKTYKVNGYGTRMAAAGKYPNIYSYSQV
jgi:hypothetical protein